MSASADTLEQDVAPRRAWHLQLFYRSFLDFFSSLPGTAKRFWLLVIATGAISGLGAVALLSMMHGIQHLAWPEAPNFLAKVRAAPAWLRVAAPLGGGLLVTALALALKQPLGGHGTAGIIEAIWVRAGRLSFFRSIGRAAISIIAVSLGVSLGREGAQLQAGAATGSWLAERLRLSDEQARLLVACGAAAGLSAVYNAPIGGALFGLEVLLGSFALELFGPIVICCVISTTISRVLVANHPSYIIPQYELMGWRELLLDVGFAPVLGLASALFVRAVDGCADLFDHLPKKLAPLWPVLVAGLVGVSAIWVPHLLGNGYDTVNLALLGELPLMLLILLPAAKLLASAMCSGSGIPGGLFTPTLYVGALIGGALGHLAQVILPGVAPPGAYALLGMGALLAGTTHASVSSVLIIFEMTGNYSIILPLMLTCVIATSVSRRIEPESLYTAALRRRKVNLPELPRPHWLRSMRARAVMKPEAERVLPQAPFTSIVTRLLLLPAGHDLYVTASDGRLLGAIHLDAIKRHITDESLLQMIVAADVMSPVEPVTEEVTLHELAVRFARMDMERLPVVDAAGKLIGTVAKRDVLERGRF